VKTAAEFIQSLRGLRREVYYLGERIADPLTHPVLTPSLRCIAQTYEVANQPEHQDLATTISHLTGERINRFTHIHRSTDDLIRKVRLQRLLGQQTGSCFQRCVGWDALNALSSVTYEIDQTKGTSYHRRFLDYLRYVQQNDLVCNGAMTDVKGDRSLRPSQQADEDLFLHVVEQNAEGIRVRGAKAHQTGAIFSHEIIVMPTMSMRAEEKAYAVSFAVPSDAPGIFHILGRQSCDTRKMEGVTIDVGNQRFGGHEALVVFEDVFVPWERVFMFGEYEFSGTLVERFAAYHRQSYGGCKVGVGDVLIGAAAAAADYNGVAKASHIRQKLIEMTHLNETLFACGIGCSAAGQATASQTYLVDLLLANVCKQNVTRFPYEISRLAEDIAGGLMVTMPSEKDLNHPKVGKYVQKYLQGRAGVPTEHRLRILRLIENLTLGTAAVAYRTESMHGAGPPEAQRIMIERQSDLEAKKAMARALAGIPAEK